VSLLILNLEARAPGLQTKNQHFCVTLPLERQFVRPSAELQSPVKTWGAHALPQVSFPFLRTLYIQKHRPWPPMQQRSQQPRIKPKKRGLVSLLCFFAFNPVTQAAKKTRNSSAPLLQHGVSWWLPYATSPFAA